MSLEIRGGQAAAILDYNAVRCGVVVSSDQAQIDVTNGVKGED